MPRTKIKTACATEFELRKSKIECKTLLDEKRHAIRMKCLVLAFFRLSPEGHLDWIGLGCLNITPKTNYKRCTEIVNGATILLT